MFAQGKKVRLILGCILIECQIQLMNTWNTMLTNFREPRSTSFNMTVRYFPLNVNAHKIFSIAINSPNSDDFHEAMPLENQCSVLSLLLEN